MKYFAGVDIGPTTIKITTAYGAALLAREACDDLGGAANG